MTAMTIRRFRIVAFLGFLFLIAASVAVTFAALQDQREDALVINLAGRQRMLVQTMALEVLGTQIGANPVYREDLHNTAHDHFEQTLDALIAGGPAPYTDGATVNLPPTRDPEILAQLETVRANWEEMHDAIHVVLESDPQASAFAGAVGEVERLSPVILSQMDEAVRLYEAEAARKVARVQYIQLGFLAAAVVLLVVVLVGSDRRLLAPLARLTAAARRIGDGDLATPVTVAGPGEIDQLARSFDDMRRNLAASRAELEAWAEQLGERVRQRTEQLSALHEITALIGGSPDVDQMLKVAVDKAAEVMDVEAAGVLLLDPEAGELRLTAYRGLSERFVQETGRVKLGEGLSGRAAASGEPVVLSNIADDPRLAHSIVREEGWRAFASVPLLSRGQVLGVLNVSTRQERAFPAEEVAMLSAVGRLLGAAIENARLHEQVKAQRVAEQAALLKLSQALLGETEPQAMMDLAVNVAAEALKVELAAAALIDPDGQSYSGRAFVGWPPEIFQPTQRIPLAARTGLGYAIQTRKPAVVPDESRETRFGAPPFVAQAGIISSLLAPMMAGEKAIGGLVVNSRTPRGWSDDEVRLLSLIANDTAEALERARLYAQAQERLERISALHDIDVAITSPLGLQATLDVLLEKVVERLRVDTAAVALAAAVAFIDQETRELVYAAKRGLDGEFFADGLLKVKEGIAGQVAYTGQVAAIPDVRAEPGFVRAAIAERLGIVSYLAVPLQARGEILGVLELATRQRHTFHPEEVDFFVTLAGQAAIVIDNTRMYEEAVRRAAQQRALAESAGGILATLDVESLWPAVTDAVRQVLAADRAAIYLYHAEADRVTCPYASGLSAGYVAEINRRFREVPGGRLLSDPRPVLIADAQTDPATEPVRDLAIREGFHSYAVFPLAAPGLPLGALMAYRDVVAPFTPDDVAAGQTLAHIAAVAVQKARLFEAERAAREQAETLRAATQALSATLDLQQVLDLILSELQRVAPYDSASVQQLKGERLEIIGGHGFPNLEELLGANFDVTAGDNPNGEVIRTRAPLILEDAPEIYPEFRRGPHAAAGIRSWLGAPLLFGDRLIGLIALDKQEPGFYTEEHARLALAFAAQAAVAIENARLYQQANQRLSELEFLHRATQAVATAPDLDAALEQVAVMLADELGYQHVGIALVDEARQSVDLRAEHGIPVVEWGPTGQGVQVGQGLVGWVAQHGEPLLVNDVTRDPRYVTGISATRSELVVPLLVGGRVIGVINVESSWLGAFDAEDMRLLSTLAGQLATAIERARLFDETRRRADELAAITHLSREIIAVPHLQHVLASIARHAAGLSSADAGGVFTVRPDGSLYIAAGYGVGDEFIAAVNAQGVLPGQGAIGRAVAERQPVQIPDVLAEPGYPFAQLTEKEHIRAILSVPMLRGEEVVGGIVLWHWQPHHFTPQEVAFVQALAQQSVNAVENARLFEAERAAREQAEMLREVARTVGSTLELDEVLHLILEQLKRVLVYDTASVLLFREDKPALVNGIGFADERLTSEAAGDLLKTSPILRQMAHDLRPVIIPDVREHPDWIWVPGAEHVRSFLAAPIVSHKRMIGALMMDSVQAGFFSQADARLAQTLAQHMAVAIENARLFEAERRQLQELLVLNEVASAAAEATSEDALIERATQVIGLKFYPDNFGLLLLDEAAGGLRFHASYHGMREEFRHVTIPLGQGISGQVAASGQPRCVPDVRREPTYLEMYGETCSELCVPLKVGERIIGVINAESARLDAFDAEDMQLLSTLAGQLATAIERLRAEEATRQAERRYRTLFEEAPAMYVVTRSRQGAPLIVDCNELFLSTLGYSRAEVLERPLADFYTPESRADMLEGGGYQQSLQGRFTERERDLATRDGRVVPTLLRAVPEIGPGGQAVGTRAMFVDITERKRAEEEVRLLQTITLAIAEAEDLHGALGVTLRKVVETTAWVLGEAWVPLPDGSALECSPAWHSTASGLEAFHQASAGFTFPPGIGLPGRVWDSKRPAWIRDVTFDPNFPRAPLARELGLKAAMGIPVLTGDEVVAVMDFFVFEPRDEDERLVTLVSAVAAQLGTVIRRKQAEAALRRRAEELEALTAVSAALRQARTRAEMLPLLVEAAMQTLRADAGTLVLLEEESLVFAAARGPGEALLGMRRPPGDDPLWQVIRTGQPLFIADVADEYIRSEFDRWEVSRTLMAGMTACACVPLQTAENTIGLLHLACRSRREATEQEKRLLTAIAEMAGSAIHRTALHAETEHRLRLVEALRNIDMAITASLDVRVTLNVFLDQAMAQLRVDAAAVLLLNPHTLTLEYAAGRGFRSRVIERSHLRLGEGYAGRAALERRAFHLPDLNQAKDHLRAALLRGEDFVGYYVTPLVVKGHVRGVFEMFHRAPLHLSPVWLSFLEALAAQASIAIDNAGLYDDLQRSNVELALAYDTTLEGWAKALELRDRETEGHTQRVTEITMSLARTMGLGEAELVHVRRGALLHDIGKMGIPDGILLKPGPLTDEEWVIMRQHPQYAYDMLHPIAYLRPALDIPYCHHEKWDGSGYPRGLKGEQTPLAARIFAIVDVWDALRSDRPYRTAWSKERVREYIQSQAGTHFDPQVVEAFLEMVTGDREERQR